MEKMEHNKQYFDKIEEYYNGSFMGRVELLANKYEKGVIGPWGFLLGAFKAVRENPTGAENRATRLLLRLK